MKKIIFLVLMPLSTLAQYSWHAGQNYDVNDENPNEDSVFTISADANNLNETSVFKIHTYRGITYPVVTRAYFTKQTVLDSALIKWEFVTNKPSFFNGAFSSLTGTPTTLSGYGITDPIVLTSGSYSNPSWITSIANSKITYSGSTSEYVRGDGSITSFPDIDAIPVGSVISGIWSSAPDGYLLLRGGTIGDATSGATVFANDLMEDLFMCLWQHLADSEAAVSGGRGASAAADWAAHKTITLPDTRQRFVLGKATSGTGTTLGGTGGQIDMVYSIDPPSTASSSDGDHNHGGATGASANINNVTLLALGSAASPSHTHTISNDGSHSHSTNISAFNTGSNNPAFISLNMAIKY